MTKPKWLPIEQAPKDGTWILARGGRTNGDEEYELGPSDNKRPVVCRWGQVAWTDEGWAYAYWDGAWLSEYVEPKEFVYLSDLMEE